MSIQNSIDTLWCIYTMDYTWQDEIGRQNHGPLPPPQNVCILIPGTCEYVTQT